MTEYYDKRVLPFTPQQMYDIVLDIERYPEFLPWCTRAEIVDRMPDENKLYASVSAGYTLYSETYLSKVTFIKNRQIEACYIEGPFENLETKWTFEPHVGGCELEFFVEFEFSKSLLNQVANQMVNHVTGKMVEAFIERAHRLCGGNNSSDEEG